MKPTNTPRGCIFCGGRPLSKEHIWPQWLGPDIRPPERNAARDEYFVTRTQKSIVTASKKRERQGDTTTKQVRAVCRACNGGWMSEMETAVKPILLPLATTLEKESLDQVAQRVLAEWISLKLMVAEHAEHGNHVSLPAHLAGFKEARKIPEGTHIYIGSSISNEWRNTFARHVTTISTPENFAAGRPRERNMQYGTIGIGLLFVLYMYCGDVDLPKYLTIGPAFRKLWPLPESAISWPPPYAMNAADCREAATGFDKLLASPRVRWMA